MREKSSLTLVLGLRRPAIMELRVLLNAARCSALSASRFTGAGTTDEHHSPRARRPNPRRCRLSPALRASLALRTSWRRISQSRLDLFSFFKVPTRLQGTATAASQVSQAWELVSVVRLALRRLAWRSSALFNCVMGLAVCSRCCACWTSAPGSTRPSCRPDGRTHRP